MEFRSKIKMTKGRTWAVWTQAAHHYNGENFPAVVIVGRQVTSPSGCLTYEPIKYIA